jgi:tetratricopeptide (TPR) repeat protein
MFAFAMRAQKGKVQTAWRGLSDYEESLKEGNPNINYLNKAKEAIDMALAHEDTKNLAKTHAYKMRISYAQFQYDLSQEMKKLEPTVADKNERMLQAYGNTGLTDFEKAIDELNKVKDLDPKFIEIIQDGLANGAASLDDDELKFAMAAQQMKIESSNIASGKYKSKKYEEAADYFFRTGVMNSILYKIKDTADFYNACIAASKSRNSAKVMEYNKKMIDAKISAPYNFESLYNAELEKGDTVAAMESLKKGRQLFPDDAGLLTQETNLFLAKGKHQEALSNLKVAVEKDPKNALYYFIIGNIYDNMANPKDKTTGKELEKPANFQELFSNAERNYLKAIELNPTNKEYLYDSNYNLGAMYNNYGGTLAAVRAGKGAEGLKLQKENDARAQEFYKKAIPYLEKALELKSDDKPTMSALRKLYLLTGNDAKAKDMGDRLK